MARSVMFRCGFDIVAEPTFLAGEGHGNC
jgi:hypothetical protein